jgi:hypothetical protein
MTFFVRQGGKFEFSNFVVRGGFGWGHAKNVLRPGYQMRRVNWLCNSWVYRRKRRVGNVTSVIFNIYMYLLSMAAEMLDALPSAMLGGGNMEILSVTSRRLSLVMSSCRKSLLVCCFAMRIGRIKSWWFGSWLLLRSSVAATRTEQRACIRCKA